MKKYRIRKLIPGYKIDKDFKGKTLVAVPETDQPIMVIHEQGIMYINDWNKDQLHRIYFEDRFNRSPYALGYFEWNPTEQIKLL